MEINGYCIWYRTGETKEELKEEGWVEAACFSSLKYSQFPQYFQAKFSNKYDAFENKGAHSTKEWLDEFVLSEKAMSGILDVKVRDDFYYVTLDLTILSYQWAFSILTLLRYPGEYYNICWNYWKIREKYTSLNKLEALYLAHQGSWFAEYRELFGHNYYYNSGHSLFQQGQKLSVVNEKKIFKTLDKYIPLSSGKEVTTIQTIWGGDGYSKYIDFNMPRCFVDSHVDKEMV